LILILTFSATALIFYRSSKELKEDIN